MVKWKGFGSKFWRLSYYNSGIRLEGWKKPRRISVIIDDNSTEIRARHFTITSLYVRYVFIFPSSFIIYRPTVIITSRQCKNNALLIGQEWHLSGWIEISPRTYAIADLAKTESCWRLSKVDLHLPAYCFAERVYLCDWTDFISVSSVKSVVCRYIYEF
jgi:hypothetical protein